MGDYIPQEELEKFLASCNDATAHRAAKETAERSKIQADNVGHKLLSKMGWKEGSLSLSLSVFIIWMLLRLSSEPCPVQICSYKYIRIQNYYREAMIMVLIPGRIPHFVLQFIMLLSILQQLLALHSGLLILCKLNKPWK